MYHFIFYFIYKAKLKTDGPGLTRYSAGMIVAIAIVIHVEFIYSLIEFSLCYFSTFRLARSPIHDLIGGSTLAYTILGLSLFFLTYKYFNEKKIKAILNRYQGVDKFYTAGNILKFILLFILPLLVSIFLVNKSVLYCR